MLGLFYRLSCLLFVMVFIFVFFRRSWYNVGAVLQIELSAVCHLLLVPVPLRQDKME